MTTEGGDFAGRNDNTGTEATPDAAAEALLNVLPFNWVSSQEEFDSMQYQYLANAVFQNYSMHLAALRQPGMDRAQFLQCLRLLYTVRAQTLTRPLLQQTNANPANDPQTASANRPATGVGSQETTNSQANTNATAHGDGRLQSAVTVKPDTDQGEPSSVVGGSTIDKASPSAPIRTATTREDKYQKQHDALQRLVSTVLYLTEMYAVAQTRGGAQVSQYRRTLTAQSHTMLVQRLARELHETEAGFWAWLARPSTTPLQGPATMV
jgi:hypothetical protein